MTDMTTLPSPSGAPGTLIESIAFDGTKNLNRRASVENAVNGSDGAVALQVLGRRADDSEVFGFKRFVKTVPTYAAKIEVPFRVNTLEGLHEGKAGDYLAIGPLGEMYPIAAEVMEASYEEQPVWPVTQPGEFVED